MYTSPWLRVGNRFAGGSLETFAAIWFASKRNGRVGILFWRLSTTLYHVYFSPAARGEPVCRRVSRDVCGDYGSPPSGKGRGNFVLASFNSSIPHLILLGCARHLRRFGSPPSGTGGCGFCIGVFPIIFTMYISPRLRGGNRFAGGSLETFAAILVRLQAEREGGDFVLASFQLFSPC